MRPIHIYLAVSKVYPKCLVRGYVVIEKEHAPVLKDEDVKNRIF